MSIAAIAWVLVAVGSLCAHAFTIASPIAGAAAVAISALWLSQLVRPADARRAETTFLAALVGLSSIVVVEGNPLLPAAAVSAALYAWDASRTSRLLIGFPRRARVRFAARYAGSTVFLGASGVLFVGSALRLQLNVRFPVAVLLGTSALLVVVGVLHFSHARSTERLQRRVSRRRTG